jgi:hypothetical protein
VIGDRWEVGGSKWVVLGLGIVEREEGTGSLSDLQGTSILYTQNTHLHFVIAIPTCREKQSMRESSLMDCHVASLLFINAYQFIAILLY